MVEVGLGLLAVCLPTLRSLFRGLPASTQDSLRGFFTLKSFRSQQSFRFHDHSAGVIHELRQDPSSSSQSRIFEGGEEGLCDVEACHMH